jgi:hypothetical protein
MSQFLTSSASRQRRYSALGGVGQRPASASRFLQAFPRRIARRADLAPASRGSREGQRASDV